MVPDAANLPDIPWQGDLLERGIDREQLLAFAVDQITRLVKLLPRLVDLVDEIVALIVVVHFQANFGRNFSEDISEAHIIERTR
jgi:hypothetical protein